MARKILLADDSVTAQNMGRKILTDAGYEVITVNNGSAALKRVGEQKPDLIVLDVYMPGYSGLEVCQRLKDSHETARIPILLTVGKLEPFKPEEARRVNADAFIVKPFEASELLSALTRLEDRMVPQADGGRFTPGIERFGDSGSGFGFSRKSETAADDTDSGWKNRIRFPSKKKVEEPEPEQEDFTVSTRDSRRGGSKSRAVTGPVPVVPAAQESNVVPDIPRDITPDELDALSALAAKLDSHVAEGAEKAPDAKPVVETAAPEAIAPPPPPPPPPPPAFEVKAEETPAATFAAAETPETAAAEATPAPAAETLPEIPVIASAVEQEGAAPQETPAAVEGVAEVASVAPVEAAPQEAAWAKDQPQPEAIVESKQEPEVEAQATAVMAETQVQEQPAAEEPPKIESIPQEAPIAAAPALAEAERVPTEEELAEALRLLTPSQAAESSASKVEEPVTVPADVVQALEQVGQNAGFVPRWMAESVALTPEEASISLEAEMFQKFSMSPATEAATPADEPAPSAPPTDSVVAEVPRVEEVPAPENAAPPVEAASKVEEPQAEPAATTFADAIQQSTESKEEAVSPAPAETTPPSDVQHATTVEDEVGGEMGRDKSKAGWSSFHAIKPGTTPVPGNDPVQAAKDAEAQSVEEAPKAMAAAAGAESSDASAIASIVDSVLADLRPKIVEEIAKKLGKK